MGVSHFSAVSSTFSVLALGAVAADKTLTTQEAQDVGIVTITPRCIYRPYFPESN